MATGEVLRFNRESGYGFARPDGGGPDVFLHASELLGVFGEPCPVCGAATTADPRSGPPGLVCAGLKDHLRPGDRVSYELEAGPKGQRAVRVRLEDGLARDDGGVLLAEEDLRRELRTMFARVEDQVAELARRRGWVR